MKTSTSMLMVLTGCVGSMTAWCATPSSIATFDRSEYSAYQSFPLTQAQDGFAGTLELWLDKKLAGKTDDASRREIGPLALDSKGYRPAIILLFDKQHDPLDVVLLEYPYARVSEEKFYGNAKSTFIASSDTNGDNGQNMFEESYFLETGNGHLRNILGTPLRSAPYGVWGIVQSRSGHRKEIFDVSREVEMSSDSSREIAYTEICTHFFFDGKGWKRETHRKKVKLDADQHTPQVEAVESPCER